MDLLWTGGWDSTFRLLSALFMEEVSVRPHYVLDPGSPGAERELDAMQRVRGALVRGRPDAAERLLPSVTASLDELPEDDGHLERFVRLRNGSSLGRHYEWLSRYARHAGLEEVELGGHRGDQVAGILDGSLQRVRESPFPAYRLSADGRGTDLALFERFTFPLVDLSRGDMRRIALERGFIDLLDETWFCQRPRRGEPCGVCEKCHAAVMDGFGYRLPASSRRRHDLKWFSHLRAWQRVVGRVVG